MEKLRIAIVGTGSRGILSFGRIFSGRDDCEIVALVDSNRVRLRAARDFLEQPEIAIYPDLAEMLRTTHLDAVVIASVDCCHKEHIITALRAGVNVLAEKPLATTTADCLEVMQAARQSGKLVNLGFNLRSHAVCRKLKELVEAGTIGRLVTVEEREYYSGGKTYFSRWNRFYDQGGGLFCHKGSHDFDIFNWLNPGARPVKVSAFAGINVFNPEGLPFELAGSEQAGPYCEVCRVGYKCRDRVVLGGKSGFTGPAFTGPAREEDGYHKDMCMYLSEKDTHDNGMVIIEYDNGVRASHSENFISPLSDRLFTLVGDLAHLDASLHDFRLTLRSRWSNEQIEYRLPPPTGGHGGADPVMVEAFVNNLKYGAAPTATVQDGTMSVLIAEAAERSRREERTVRIEELISATELANLSDPECSL